MTLHADQRLLRSRVAWKSASHFAYRRRITSKSAGLASQLKEVSSDMNTLQKSDEKESEIKGDSNGRRDACRSISVRIQDIWESQTKLEEKGELHEGAWKRYYQSARWPRRVHILGKWREKVVPKVDVPQRFVEWVFRQSIWIVSFFLCCMLYLC